MSKDKIKHILFIRLSAMGDVAMVTPVIFQFVTLYPDVRVTVLTRGFFTPIFKGIPNVRILSPDLYGRHKGIIGVYQLSREIYQIGISAVADFHGVLRTHLLTFFLRMRNIKVVKIDKGRIEKKALTRLKNKKFIQLKHTTQRYADVLDSLGFPMDIRVKFLSKRPYPKNIFSSINTKKIGIAPFAAYKTKTYPIGHIESIIRTLSQRDSYELFLFGSNQREQKEVLQELERKYPNTTSLAGIHDFESEIAAISNLDIMVSMDSANGHLSAMFGVPVVVIWGETHPYAGFSPLSNHINILPDLEKFPRIPSSIYGNKSSVLPEDQAINSISPSLVIQAIDGLLSRKKGL